MGNDTQRVQSLVQTDIFQLLGADDATPEEREVILGDLQDVIWDEVVHANEEKLTPEAVEKIHGILEDDSLELEAKRNSLYGALVDMIPQLDQVLADHTEEIKRSLLQERLEGTMSFHAKDEAKTRQLQALTSLYEQGNYQDVISGLNAL